MFIFCIDCNYLSVSRKNAVALHRRKLENLTSTSVVNAHLNKMSVVNAHLNELPVKFSVCVKTNFLRRIGYQSFIKDRIKL